MIGKTITLTMSDWDDKTLCNALMQFRMKAEDTKGETTSDYGKAYWQKYVDSCNNLMQQIWEGLKG